jgi:hypothetical protein
LNEGGDTITDFTVGLGGDMVDLSALGARLGWDSNDFLAQGNIRAVAAGSDTLVEASNGAGGWVSLATLIDVDPRTFNAANVQTRLSEPGPRVLSVFLGANDGSLMAGEKVTINVTFSDKVTVSGSGLSLSLDNGGMATYVGGTGTNNLAFSYTAGSTQNTVALGIEAFNLGTAKLTTTAGETVKISHLDLVKTIVVDTIVPTVSITNEYLLNGSYILKGLAEPSSTVSVFENSTLLGKSTANSSQVWSFAIHAPDAAIHTYKASAVDGAGNRGTSTTIAVSGSTNSDIILGTALNEILTGNSGNDVFRFGSSFGRDKITDFRPGTTSQEFIEFNHPAFDSFSDVMAKATQVGSNIVITPDSANSLTLLNLQLSQLTAGDFHFL